MRGKKLSFERWILISLSPPEAGFSKPGYSQRRTGPLVVHALECVRIPVDRSPAMKARNPRLLG